MLLMLVGVQEVVVLVSLVSLVLVDFWWLKTLEAATCNSSPVVGTPTQLLQWAPADPF